MKRDFAGYWRTSRACMTGRNRGIFHDYYAVSYASLRPYACT